MSEVTVREVQEEQGWLDKPLLSALALDWEKGLYIAFIVLALFTRFYALGDRVVSHDEVLHTQYSYQYYRGDGYQHTPLMHGPFLFHITAASYWLFGDNDFTARIPVALFGVLLVGMPYFLRSWLGRRGALCASFLLLISPYITYYSRYIRHDIYAIVAAMIVLISTFYYLRKQEDRYLYWFGGGLGLLFVTKEVSFIYVAIFGSFLVLRLLASLLQSPAFRRDAVKRLVLPLLIVALGVGLVGGGLLLDRMASPTAAAEMTEEEPISADPNATATTDEGHVDSSRERLAGWAELGGLLVLSVGVFMMARNVRHHLDGRPEFDLIVLYTSLVVTLMAALLVSRIGINPRDFTVRACQLAGEAEMNQMTLLLARLRAPTCYTAFLSSPMVISALTAIGLLVVSILVGWWWNLRRWIVPALLFFLITTLLYTSMFTWNRGWYSGYVDSLAYWLEQQAVERGNQPRYYYFFVTPLYEFLPLLLALLGARLWLSRQRLSRFVGYWVSAVLIGLLAYSFTGWIFNRSIGAEEMQPVALVVALFALAAWLALTAWRPAQFGDAWWFQALPKLLLLSAVLGGMTFVAFLPLQAATVLDPETQTEVLQQTRLPGMLALGIVLAAALVYWIIWRRRDAGIAALRQGVDVEMFFGFVPQLIWWTVLSWLVYSWAGEKMPWLSTHLALPMILLGGWYMGQRLRQFDLARLFNRRSLMVVGVALLLLLTSLLILQTLLVGIDWGSQTQANLQSMGALFGRIALLLLLGYLFYHLLQRHAATAIGARSAWFLAGVLLLTALTIRFTYMANFVNGDYPNEYLVYAHGHPATKGQVMRQIEEISMRLEGDKTMRVSYDNKSSWPYFWYLRDYPNNHYFGETPGADIQDSPVILAGSPNWDAVEQIIGDDYEAETYSYIWWPMEEYRNISWNALFGVNDRPDLTRGLDERAVRQSLWDIFLYRDFEQYGETFGGSYRQGQWPLRADLRLYIRKDVLAKLWDSGISAANYEPPVDPYALGELVLSAELIFGVSGSKPGQLTNPRNAAVAADGRIYVVDSGNHRIQVFNAAGDFVSGFGDFGSEPGQFNEPWGIDVDGEFVYVADTWNGRIQKFTLDGDFVTSFGRFEIPAAGTLGELQFYGPRSVVVADGRVYVTDTGNHRIHVTDLDGAYLDQIGGEGFALGEFNEPVGLTVDESGNLYVAEAWSERIQQLSADLQPFSEWPIEAWEGNSLDNKPYLTAANGYLYATDPEGNQILIFDKLGSYRGRFGRFGSDGGSFNLPTGITSDADGNLYVIDSGNSRVMKFAPVIPPLTLE